MRVISASSSSVWWSHLINCSVNQVPGMCYECLSSFMISFVYIICSWVKTLFGSSVSGNAIQIAHRILEKLPQVDTWVANMILNSQGFVFALGIFVRMQLDSNEAQGFNCDVQPGIIYPRSTHVSCIGQWWNYLLVHVWGGMNLETVGFPSVWISSLQLWLRRIWKHVWNCCVMGWFNRTWRW